jgi:hypothetical protein
VDLTGLNPPFFVQAGLPKARVMTNIDDTLVEKDEARQISWPENWVRVSMTMIRCIKFPAGLKERR